jgi:hypothetical protein
VKKWVGFYKKHRAILDSDIIHVRRPDGRDIDCMMHVNPQLKERALAMVYNPQACFWDCSTGITSVGQGCRG